MKSFVKGITALLGVSVIWVQGAQADDSAVKATPLELYACSWQEGKGMDDLDKVTNRFNKWSDKNQKGYSAWTITPQFRSSDTPFHLGWIGAWADGATMGAGLQAYRDKGQDLAAAFADVVDCSDSHGLFSSVSVNAPKGEPSKNPLVQFSSCTMDDDASSEDVYAAHKAASDFMISKGGMSAAWLLWPVLGAGDIEFDYYSVVSYESYAQLGQAFEAYSNDGGWQKINDIMKGVVSCDEPRLYDGKLIRMGSN
jgi:hypothetical protein